MPSSATITSFYNFTANTKARASQVNNNFDVIRGHFIPIHVSTATSANNTYDLGSYEYRWRKAYAYDLEIGSTSTNSATINIDTATSTAEIVFKLNGTEKARINTNGVKLNSLPFSATTTAAFGFVTDSSLTMSNVSTSRAVNISFFTDATNGGIVTFGLMGTSTVTEIGLYLKRDSTVLSKIIRAPISSTLTFPIQALNFVDYSPSTNPVYYLASSATSGGTISFGTIKMAAHQI